MKTISEQILSFAESELLEKESIRRAVLHAAPQKQKKPIPWAKILLPVAASLVLVCGTVLAVPKTRAELARWLRIERPEQYLTEDPENRTPNETLDSLIVPPASAMPEETVQQVVSDLADAPKPSPLPIGSVTSNRIRYVCGEPIWQQIAQDFSMELGETMFDGHDLCLSVTMKGLAALPEVEALSGGSATQYRIPPELLEEYWENGEVPEAYLDGTLSMYETMRGRYYLVLDDGAEVPLGPGSLYSMESNPELITELERIQKTYGKLPTDADREAISEHMIDWLSGRELRSVVRRMDIHKTGEVFFKDGKEDREVQNLLDYLLSKADANGMLSGTVVYRIATDVTGLYEVKLEAELGTTSFDLAAYKSITGDTLYAEAPEVVFVSREVPVSYSRYEMTPGGREAYTVTNIPTDLAGVTIRVGGDATIDGLGVHGIDLTVTLPNAWTKEQCEGFFGNLWFVAGVEGEQTAVHIEDFEEIGDRCIRYTMEVRNIPYDRIDRIETVRLIPRLLFTTALLVGDTRTELIPNETYSEPKTKQNVQWAGDSIDLGDGVVFTRVR